jgi:hypothetical protein
MLGSPERGLSGIPEDIGHRAAFAGRDTVIEIFKDPIHLLPQGATYAAFAGSHKADEANTVTLRTGKFRDRPFGPHTDASPRVLARTFFQKSASTRQHLATHWFG